MRDFFKPWRHKLGVVTLMLACVLAAGWVRSMSEATNVELPNETTVLSFEGNIEYGLYTTSGCVLNFITFIAIPYWAIVAPLTLLSACLLVSKPRPAGPKRTTAPTSITRA